jgi:MFS transporter, PAT family, solute carrier family 33 (acetyl-CoA transportor), member 1
MDPEVGVTTTAGTSLLEIRGGSSKQHPSKQLSRVQKLYSGLLQRDTVTNKFKVQIFNRAILSNDDRHDDDHSNGIEVPSVPPPAHDRWNYALLILLYTLQGIPMGLSASIPFLLQEKIKIMASATAAGASLTTASAAATTASFYNANAIFALCSWPFSLKLLWAPLVDALYWPRMGRRKSWLIPVQTLAGCLMVGGANFVEQELGLLAPAASTTMNVRGVTSFFFVLYFLMATQDIAVDGWALTMLSKPNRGKGPICNSIGQNLGYFLSFVGFLALNDVEASESLWRPLLRLPSNPAEGLVRLRGFLRFMGFLMLGTTLVVALFKRELPASPNAETLNSQTVAATSANGNTNVLNAQDQEADDAELDAAMIGIKETYHRLWAVCQLPAVRMLFLILVSYRLPVALSDNVKFLKAVEYGLSKSTTALLSPTLILPLGIFVPIIAHKIWHMAPLQQFLTAYQFRVTLIPMLDILMLHLLKSGYPHNSPWFWLAVIASTAGQAICQSLQFNAQMIFFASRVDPAIGGSYMTLLNTAANLGGTWPSSFVMWLLGFLSTRDDSRQRDAYTSLQLVFSILGLSWLFYFGPKLRKLAVLPPEAWRTHLAEGDDEKSAAWGPDMESGETFLAAWQMRGGRRNEKAQ